MNAAGGGVMRDDSEIMCTAEHNTDKWYRGGDGRIWWLRNGQWQLEGEAVRVLLEKKVYINDDDEFVLMPGARCTFKIEIEEGKLRINVHPENEAESAHLMVRRSTAEFTIAAPR